MQLSFRSSFSLALCIGLTIMVVMALSFGSMAAVLPLIVGIPTLLLLLGQTILDLFYPSAKSASGGSPPPTLVSELSKGDVPKKGLAGLALDPGRRSVPFWIALLWPALFYLGYSYLGYVITVPVVLLLYLKLQVRLSWQFSLAFSLSLGLFVYLVFHLFMGLRVS